MKLFFYILTFIFFTFSLNSCKILRSPRIKASSNIKGISSKNPQFHKSNQFIIIHGIGTQKNDYSEKLIRRLNNYQFGTNTYKYDIWTYNGEQFVEHLNIDYNTVLDEYSNNGDDIEIIKIKAHSLNSECKDTNLFYSINWSVLIEKDRDKLRKIEMDGKPFFRGTNRLAKRMILINNVSDAFTGSKSNTLEYIVKGFIKIIDNGNLLKNENINLISGSFGSQLFLATLLALQDESFYKSNFFGLLNQNNLINDSTMFKINKNNKISLNMYMLTNQLNLMPDNVIDWANSICNNKFHKDSTKLNFKEVNITAFRNPNDLLCYYVPIEALKNIFKVPNSSINLVNAYYFNWPIRNDVLFAHTSVFKLKKLSKIIYYGSDSNWERHKKGYK